MILFDILESEDSYENLESVISKGRKYSITFVCHLILFIFVIFIHLAKHTALPTSVNYIAVSVDLNCFRIYSTVISVDMAGQCRPTLKT